ncbi:MULTISPECIES: hypothetical protein [unclassified Collinsella]|uniref:hypothetical protein n=1 Tax=unclassified Collinsella TaxID=2637548 RepID=UPI0012B2C497|nr:MULTISPECIES: hypothetical protein [unclassified Collinsella]MSS26175.1 hypothetical protein [Collinsella sp. WCA1-178-WT-3 (M2)]MSS52350.1 hypothetical protein [Collinsella sp. WCA1-178-WT-3 (M1)]
MFAAAFHTSRHYILFIAMACLCVLLGGPSYAAGAESLIIAGATYYEPGVSGPGWAWTDADRLELNGYTGEAIGADGDLVVTLTGQNTVDETSAPDVDISQCGMEVWGDLTLRGTGSLVATGSQCGIYVSGTLAVDGCKVDARADGDGITEARVAGVIADGLAVRCSERFVAAGAGSGADVLAYGVCLPSGAAGGGAAGKLTVDASWLDASGAEGGVACLGGSLASARFVAPKGGAFGDGGVVDAGGAVAPHVVIEPVDTTAPAGEAGGPDVPDGAGDPAGDAGPTVEQPSAGSVTDPVLKAATATPKTTATTKTTVTKTTASTPSKAKTASAATVTLPKTADINWIAASLALFLPGTALLGRCLLPLS